MARLKALDGGGVPDGPRNAKEALHQADGKHLECRDLRHPWSVVGVFQAQGTHGKEVRRKLVCPRCGCEATDRWTPRGARVARVYKYPPGYSNKGVTIKPQDVRREVLSRVNVYSSEEDMREALFQSGSRKRA